MLLAADGTPRENNRVFPFGEAWIEPPGSNDNQKFTTYQRDSESDLDYAMARSYAYAMGRFMTSDPGHVGANIADPQSWNAYVYSRTDPITLTDPTGTTYQVCLWTWGADCTAVQEMSDESFDRFVSENGFMFGSGNTLFYYHPDEPEYFFFRTAIDGLGVNYAGGGNNGHGSGGGGGSGGGARVNANTGQVPTELDGLAMVNGQLFQRLIAFMSRWSNRLVRYPVLRPPIDLNHLRHIFSKPEHNLDPLLKVFGGDPLKAFNAVQTATDALYVAGGIPVQAHGVFNRVAVQVGSQVVYVNGAIVNGVIRIGTFGMKQ
jgi:RHS repeat-associated protein